MKLTKFLKQVSRSRKTRDGGYCYFLLFKKTEKISRILFGSHSPHYVEEISYTANKNSVERLYKKLTGREIEYDDWQLFHTRKPTWMNWKTIVLKTASGKKLK